MNHAVDNPVESTRPDADLTYDGPSVQGLAAGDGLLSWELPGHTVQYHGQLSNDGATIDGRWRIDADPRRGVVRTDGSFTLRREAAVDSPHEDGNRSSPL